MRNWPASVNNTFWLLQVVSFSIYVGAPLCYLVIAQIAIRKPVETGNLDLITIGALLFAMSAPLMNPILRREMIRIRTKMRDKVQNPEKSTLTGFIIFGSLIEASFLLGLIIFFLSNEIQRMLYFYPIGIFWTLKYWPTAERFEQLLNELSAP